VRKDNFVNPVPKFTTLSITIQILEVASGFSIILYYLVNLETESSAKNKKIPIPEKLPESVNIFYTLG